MSEVSFTESLEGARYQRFPSLPLIASICARPWAESLELIKYVALFLLADLEARTTRQTSLSDERIDSNLLTAISAAVVLFTNWLTANLSSMRDRGFPRMEAGIVIHSASA